MEIKKVFLKKTVRQIPRKINKVRQTENLTLSSKRRNRKYTFPFPVKRNQSIIMTREGNFSGQGDR